MAAALTPYSQPEPFQEMTVSGPAPPDELEEYYRQLERVELERRASKKSRWSRKSFRGVDMHIEELVRARELRAQRDREQRARGTPDDSRAPSPEPDDPQHAPHGPPPPIQRPAHQLPPPQSRTWAVATANPVYKKYEIFNPVGPKYYTNHHLSPKSETRAPSVFSPNFPAFPSTPEVATPDEGKKPTRQLSFSPAALETQSSPDHLQPEDGAGARFPQPSNGKLRRKSPNTTPTDETRNNPMTRSATVPYSTSRMTPSPLSQSVTTLQVPEQPRISRKLSKRNSTNRGFRNLFSSRSESEDVGGTQAYAGPSASTASLATANSRPRPVSIAAAPTQPPTKRMSVLGKLAKKLSLAKHTPEPSMVVARRGATTDGSPSARPAAFGVVTPTEPAAHAFPHHPPQPQPHSPSFPSSSSSSNGTPPAQPERRTPSPSKARRVPPPELEYDQQPYQQQQEQQQPAGLLHEGARVASPPPITESVSEPIMQLPRLVEPPPPPPSEGRSSPDAQFFIGNLMLANPDEYAQTEPSSTPRAAPLPLPPPPPGRFQIESMYSDTAATGSTGSLPLLQVVNPSAPTPNPEEQLEMLRRATPPPLPPPHVPAPEPQRALSSPVIPTARRPVSTIFNPAAAPSPAPASAPTTRPASSNTRTDSDKSERRISRKPPPNVSPSMQARSPATTQSPNGSARSTPTQDPTTLVMAKYASDAAGSPQVERRELLTVNGEEWEVVPVGEAKLDPEVVQVNASEPEQRRRTSSRATKPERQERESSSRWAKRMEREPSKRSRTLSKPERHVQREPSHTSSRAPSPPPKSVHRYRLERKTSTDVRTPPTSPPESPSKGDRVDRNKSMPAPPTPSKSMRRPVSDLFDHTPQGHLGAQEAYRAERMRKGMSFVGGKDAELPLPPVPSRDPSYEARRDTSNSLGSGHTAFVMTPPIARPGAF